MKENLGLATPKNIKTFKISYNENYTTPLVGYGITTGEKLQRMPNLIGQDEYYVQNWCTSNGITCEFKEITHSATKGTITYQEVHEGVLLKSITYALFDVSNGKGVDETKKPTKEDEEDNEETGSNKEETEKPKDENNKDETEKPKDENTETPKEEPTTPTTPETPTEEPTTPAGDENEEQ